MARFIPAEQVQQQAMPQGAGMDAGDYLGLAKTGAGLAGTGARFLSADPTITGGLGTAGGLLGIGTGAAKLAEGNYAGGAGDIATGGIAAARGLTQAGYLPASTTPALGAAAGLAGLGLGGYQLSQGDLGGIPSLYGGALGTTAAAGEMLGGTAAGASAATAAGTGATAAEMMAGAVNPLTLAIGAFIAIGMMNMQSAEAKRIKNQTQESGQIRQGATSALNQLQGTNALAQNQRFIPADQLAGAMEQYRGALNAAPVGNQLLSTRGVGGDASRIKPLADTQLDAYRAQYEPALQNSQVGYTRAADASAQLGQLPDWALTSFGTTDPAALLQSLGTGGFNPYWDVNYSNVVPGNYGQQLPAIMQNFDPNYAQSATAQRFQQIPAMNLPGQTPLTPQQIAAFNQTRQDTATTGLNNYIAGINDYSGADQSGINASGNIGAGAPYLGGGSLEAAQALGLAPQTISDLKSGQTDWQTAVRQEQLRKLSGGASTGDAP